MSKLRANNFSISIDGYGAGPNQSIENPLGPFNALPAPATPLIGRADAAGTIGELLLREDVRLVTLRVRSLTTLDIG